MLFDVRYERSVPARKPDGHSPAAPRYSLRWERPITAIISDYFAIQKSDLTREQEVCFFAQARKGFAEKDGPDSFEIFRSVDEYGLVNAIVVAYWTDAVKHARWDDNSSLTGWFRDPARLNDAVGAWRETISVPYDRHETIYSESFYKIGIGRTEGSVVSPTTTNGYFGAARDRVPISAIDPLESPFEATSLQVKSHRGVGQRLRLSVPVNMVTLRSGQYWAHAEQEQLDDYINNMHPRLMTGMSHLIQHKGETGTLSLLVMTNLNDDGSERKETCVYAHFLSLKGLEAWSASHKTHLDIYRHAIAMNRKYKQERQFVSWHELFVSQKADFEYVNCDPRTGLLRSFRAVEING